ncbi:MAG TPA: TetR/AcrR family transcriptional regulator [Spirochaetota bacterium]|nr:TetR/AcrR family transcriptional regulator [Spirochaetota bacterium]
MSESNTFSKLRKQEKDLRRNIIIDAAEEEFVSKPFNKVNMRDIAKKAGISPASIYRYFPDQQSLFIEAFVRGTIDIFEKLSNTVNNSKDGSIEKVADDFTDYFTRNDQYFRMMMHFFLEGPVDSVVFEKLIALERKLLDAFDIIFQKMNVKEDVRLYSQAFFSGLVGMVATFRNHPDKSDEDVLRHRKRIARMFSRMIVDAFLYRNRKS